MIVFITLCLKWCELGGQLPYGSWRKAVNGQVGGGGGNGRTRATETYTMRRWTTRIIEENPLEIREKGGQLPYGSWHKSVK